jgi:aryl-alcohol dehydrogenase-like predicted oxidoreductase
MRRDGDRLGRSTHDLPEPNMGLTDYRTLGRSGLRVSPLCLGAMTFGEQWGFGTDEAGSVRQLDLYEAGGGNFIDAANIYTKGHSERILGDWLAAGGASRRDRTVLATKFGGSMHRGDPNAGGSGRVAIMRACEASLRRLRTDRIDLYWVHFWDDFTPLEELMRSLDLLVQQGKVRYVGFSDHPAWVCARAQSIAEFRGWTPLAAIQIEWSLLQRTVERELVPMARELGMGVCPWSPLRGGVLTGKFTRAGRQTTEETRVRDDSKHLHERTYDLIDAMKEIADAHACTVPQVAIAWLDAQPGCTSTILGARTAAQLEDTLASLEVALTPEQLARLDELTAPPDHFPQTFLEAVRTTMLNGARIDGIEGPIWDLSPADDSERA